MLLTTAALCLALNVFNEARGEPLAGQHAVAQVTLNRAGRNNDKVCDVVFEPKQFSWTAPYRNKTTLGKLKAAQKKVPKNDKAWELAKAVAKLTVAGFFEDITKGATYFHAKQVRPQWAKEMKLVAIIGQHRFYRQLA